MRHLTRRASLVLAIAVATPAAGQQPTAQDFLAAIYRPYLDRDSKPRNAFDNADSLFVADLANALKNDPDRNAGMVGKLDFDPFVVGQAWDLSNLSIVASTSADGAKAHGVATFVNLGRPQEVTYDLVRTPAGWRIADVKWSRPINGAASLRGLYALK